MYQKFYTTAMCPQKKVIERRFTMIKTAKHTKKLISAIGGLVALSVLVTTVFASGILSNSMAGWDKQDQEGLCHGVYADLTAIAAFDTPYVGNNSKVGGLINLLPPLSDFHKQRFFSIESDEKPYGLTVYYESKGDYDGKQNPFSTSDAENNALILFAYIGNLGKVTFSFRDDLSGSGLDKLTYAPRYSFIREDFTAKYGDLSHLKKDLPAFYRILDDNLLIDEDRLHYDRIRLGSDDSQIIYRLSEPTEIVENADGSSILRYENLGEVRYRDSKEVVIPGDDVTLYMDYHPEATGDALLNGVCKLSIVGSSEMLYNLNIKEGTYSEITNELGKPTNESVNKDGSVYMEYLLKNSNNHYAYFVIRNNILVEHGLTAMAQ